MTTMTYSARVTGMTWEGFRCWTVYSFSFLPTREQVLKQAGDFSRVLSITMTRTTTNVARVPVK